MTREAWRVSDQESNGPAISQYGLPCVYNYSSKNAGKLAKSKSHVINGSARMRVLCIGNSKTRGVGPNLMSKSYPSFLSQGLEAKGLPAVFANFIGNGNIGLSNSDYHTYQPELTINAGWDAYGAGSVSTAGFHSWNNSTTTNNLSFSAPGTVDTFEIYYARGASSGTFAADIDGGTATTQATNGSGVGLKTVTAGAAGAHTLNIRPNAAGQNIHVIGVVAYDSTVKAVDVINAGWGGSTSDNHVGTGGGYGPLSTYVALNPNVVLLALDTNDYTPSYWPGMGATDLASALTIYEARMRTIIEALYLTSTVIIVAELPSNPTRQAMENQNLFAYVERRLAAEYGLIYASVRERAQSFEVWNGLGFYADDTHGNANGYADQGYFLAELIARL